MEVSAAASAAAALVVESVAAVKPAMAAAAGVAGVVAARKEMRPTVVAATEVEVRVATEVRVAVEARAAVEVRVAREVEMAAMDFQWIGVVAPWTGATNERVLVPEVEISQLSPELKLPKKAAVNAQV